MYCNSCGSMIPDGMPYCGNCRAPTPQHAPQPAYQPVVPNYAQPTQPVMITPPVSATRSNGIAIAGLIMGILSLCFFWFPGVGALFATLGLIFSIIGVARRNARAKGCAITGLILSILGMFLFIVMMLGVNTYLNKARAAASSIRRHNAGLVISIDDLND